MAQKRKRAARKRNRLFAYAASAFWLRCSTGPVPHGSYMEQVGTIDAETKEAAEKKLLDGFRERGEFQPPAYGQLQVLLVEISPELCAAFAK